MLYYVDETNTSNTILSVMVENCGMPANYAPWGDIEDATGSDLNPYWGSNRKSLEIICTEGHGYIFTFFFSGSAYHTKGFCIH